MTDRPVLFSTAMVRALLDGRKTQTRLVLTGKSGITPAHRVERAGQSWLACEYDRRWPLRLPYVPGDRLWVRETWRAWTMHDADRPAELPRDLSIQFAADDARQLPWDSRTRSPIHMPRWASRLTLTVTDVRVQRLQEISDDDALAEGVAAVGGRYLDDCSERWHSCTVAEFRALWNSINGPDAWAANPWVVAVTFDVAQRNIDEVIDHD